MEGIFRHWKSSMFAQKITWTGLCFFAGLISLHIWNLEIVILFAFVLLVLQIADVISWFCVSKKYKTTFSKIAQAGILEKFWVQAFGLITIILVGMVYTSTGIESFWGLHIWIIPLVYYIWFMFPEIISFLENLTLLTDNKNTTKLFKFIKSAIERTFNNSLDNLKAISEKKIKDIFDKKTRERFKDKE